MSKPVVAQEGDRRRGTSSPRVGVPGGAVGLSRSLSLEEHRDGELGGLEGLPVEDALEP